MQINTLESDKIGGCITEIISGKNKIIIDYGSNLDDTKQIDIQGLTKGQPEYDAVLISHYHMDHIGEIIRISEKIPVYVEKTTKEIYEVICDFSSKKTRKVETFEFGKKLPQIGDLEIVAYRVDHSAYNSAMFLITEKSTGQTALYTGDFRDNGYKGEELLPTIEKIAKQVKKLDYLIIEGTNIGSNSHILVKESALIDKFAEVCNKYKKVFVMMSASNIDRIVTLYEAANKTNHTLIEDVYMAHLTNKIYINDQNDIPNPKSFDDVMVYKPLYLRKKEEWLKEKYYNTFDEKNNNKILYKPFIMNIRTSMKDDLKKVFKERNNLKNSCLVYSMWSGYKKKKETKEFIEYAEELGIDVIKEDIHTSGHASEKLIKKVINTLKPKNLKVIHTEKKDKEVKTRTHQTLKECKEKFQYYKMLTRETITSKEELNKRYEEELIKILKKKRKKYTSLKDVIEDIENTNPFEKYSERRTDFRANDRISLKTQEKVQNKFCSITNGIKDNSLETMIQRNIMLSEQYNDVLGIPVYYEFACDKNKSGAIDLITYKKEENTLYLVELKKCKAKLNPEKSNEKESIETFLRASFEVSTYYSLFTHLISDEKYRVKVEKAFKDVSNLDIDLQKVKIKKAILAPTRVYNDIYTKELKELKKRYDCFSIELADNVKDLSKYKINSKEKLFKIEKIK